MALITGASRGLGAAIALELGACGMQVAVNYFKGQTAAEAVCARIVSGGGIARAFKADVRDEGEIDGMVREIEGVFGGVDVLEPVRDFVPG